MSNKKLGIILLAVVGVIVGVFLIFKLTNKKAVAPANDDMPLTQQQVSKSSEVKPNDLQGSKQLSTAEVKKHDNESDCWTIISGKVYDITKYVERHPGGKEILRACGADATTLFTQRKTVDGQSVGSGTPHSSSAEVQLQQFLLGDLQQ